MAEPRQSNGPGGGRVALRRRLDLKGELLLALLPTATVLIVLALVEGLTRQRLLFSSLASSAFLIYLDPEHSMNGVRTLVSAQLLAAVLGLLTYLLLGSGYISAAAAMVATIFLMIVLNVAHPPAVSTAMSFALRAGKESNLAIFGLAVGITAILVLLEQAALWLMRRQSQDAAVLTPD